MQTLGNVHSSYAWISDTDPDVLFSVPALCKREERAGVRCSRVLWELGARVSSKL